MLRIRVIPILTFNGFALVKTKQFGNPRMVGNPVQSARVYNSRMVDELVFLDITASEQKRTMNYAIVREVIKECYMPVGIGGGISKMSDIEQLLNIGADKVVMKTMALTNPLFIKEAARIYGSQCITITIDAKKAIDGRNYTVYNKLGVEITVEAFIERLIDHGAGELIVNAVDRDGMMGGFDTELVCRVEALSSIPIIACGGAGNPGHFIDLFSKTGIEAVGAASIYHFTQYTPMDVKHALASINKPVRL